MLITISVNCDSLISMDILKINRVIDFLYYRYTCMIIEAEIHCTYAYLLQEKVQVYKERTSISSKRAII